MRFFDTKNQGLIDFVAPKTVRLYVCGITPYDSAHLGHAFVYTSFDILIRRFLYDNRRVLYVRNVTDLDDDTLRTAKKRDIHFQVLARSENASFEANLKRLGLIEPTYTPFVTDTMDAMVPFIKGLIDKGAAYTLDDHRVYFDVSHEDFLSFSKLDEEEALKQFREKGGDPDAEGKKNQLDFLLWQPSGEDEPSWEAPWGAGRPGWHIECSVMANEYLGNTIDIHGGGSDLIYPHHESEILQSETLTGQKPFSNLWLHIGMVALDGEKMSKSLGNLVFINDLLDDYCKDSVKIMLLENHYRSNWTYTPDKMSAASKRVQKWKDFIGEERINEIPSEPLKNRFEINETELFKEALAALDDDLNTPKVLDILDQAVDSEDIDSAILISRLLGLFQNTL